jgi:hypothetical protein
MLPAGIVKLAVLAGISPAIASSIFPRDYTDTVCKPATLHEGDTVPPCVEIGIIEMLCSPNGTQPLDYAAHQQCMCHGSYFSEWPFCQQCLYFHGLRSQRDLAQYESILTVASSSFCGAATPTDSFASYFATVEATAVVPTTGSTVSSDQAVSQTAVSLYFTASGSQGPGAITGAATAATLSGLVTASQGSLGSQPVTGGGGATKTTTSTSTTATTTKTGGAAGFHVDRIIVLAVSVGISAMLIL